VVGNAATPAYGQAAVLGYTANTQSTSYTYEVAKYGMSGVWGDTTGNPTSSLNPSAGVIGTTDASLGYGGLFIAKSANADGVFAKNLSTGNGIYGESVGAGVSDNAGTGGSGVEGFTPSPAEGQAGVVGNAYQLSATYGTVKATGPVGFVAGVWGDAGEVNDNTGTYESGIVGTGDDITAALFENDSPSGHPTVSAVSLYNNTSGTLFTTLVAAAPDGVCGFGSGGDMNCTGRVKALVSVGDGERKVETYAVQSPESWMEDFGSGELQRGVAVVKIDPGFAETVTADASYHVFITPNGDSEGLYVINKTATSFEVRESKGGTSSLSFDYRIVARRRGYEAQRLTDVTDRFKAEKAIVMPPQQNPGGPVRAPRVGVPRHNLQAHPTDAGTAKPDAAPVNRRPLPQPRTPRQAMRAPRSGEAGNAEKQ
jgi:hypothetical protein